MHSRKANQEKRGSTKKNEYIFEKVSSPLWHQLQQKQPNQAEFMIPKYSLSFWNHSSIIEAYLELWLLYV